MRVPLMSFLALIFSAYGAEPANTPPDAEIEQRVKLLGSDDFNERQAAERSLEKIGDAAERALQAAEKGDDAETCIRATRLLVNVRWNRGCKEEAAWLAKLGPTLGTSRPGDKASGVIDSTKVGDDPNHGGTDVWLASNQEADGHWDSKKFGAQSDADIEQTALALLAFLGAGHSERVGRYKTNVKNGLDWLRKLQREDGAFTKPGQPVDGIAHALAGLAMAEAAGMGNLKPSKDSAQLAFQYSTANHQVGTGSDLSGFTRAAHSTDPDLLTTMFFTMQMKSTKIAGLKVGAESFDGALKFLKLCEAGSGKGYSFTPGLNPSPKATFAGCLIGMSMGYTKDQFELAAAHAFEGFRPVSGEEDCDALMTYIGTLVIFNVDNHYQFTAIDGEGRGLWKLWNDTMIKNLQKQMIQDGPAACWNPTGTWASGGRLLATELHCLSLEIYYRYKQLKR